MSQTRLESAFETGAIKFSVNESDYLLLKNEGMNTYESLYYRIPTKDDLEAFLQEVICGRRAYKDRHGNVGTFNGKDDWSTWKRSEDAGCLRKRWSYGATLCKSELEDMASGSGSGEKIKFTSSAAAELEQRAVAAGMEAPVSDVERPSLWTLQKVANNHALGGKLVHLEWEIYVSMEAEERLGRSGKALKKRPAVFLVGGKTLEVQEQEVELEGVVKITGLVTLREVLSLRARAMAMLELLPYSLSTRLQAKYLSMARQTIPDRMRAPTLNEIRRFDREMFKQALRWKSEAQGEMADCVAYYLDTPDAGLWRTLDPVPESLPDQGRDRQEPDGGVEEKPAKRPRGPEPPLPPPPDDQQYGGWDQEGKGKARRCIVCGKKHEPRCPLPEGFRKELKAKQKAAKAKGKGKEKGGKGKKGGDHGGDPPE